MSDLFLLFLLIIQPMICIHVWKLILYCFPFHKIFVVLSTDYFLRNFDCISFLFRSLYSMQQISC